MIPLLFPLSIKNKTKFIPSRILFKTQFDELLLIQSDNKLRPQYARELCIVYIYEKPSILK